MKSVFGRRGTDTTDSGAEDRELEPEDPVTLSKSYTPGKGRATPKRSQSSTRRRIVSPPPKDPKAAKAQAREKAKQDRIEAREGMARGEERYLLARDRGPERRLVRNIVDARYTVGSWFLLSALIVVFASSNGMPQIVRTVALSLWLVLILAIVVDGYLITRRVKRGVAEHFPKSNVRPRSLYVYAVTRSIMIRRWRNPKPQVKLGEKV